MKIKKWFLERKFSTEDQLIINQSDIIKLSETERAVKVKVEVEVGKIEFWCPKSCLMSDQEAKALEIEAEKKKKRGLAYNSFLLQYAKENGVKHVRKGLKTTTLIKKIEEVGLEVPD